MHSDVSHEMCGLNSIIPRSWLIYRLCHFLSFMTRLFKSDPDARRDVQRMLMFFGCAMSDSGCSLDVLQCERGLLSSRGAGTPHGTPRGRRHLLSMLQDRPRLEIRARLRIESEVQRGEVHNRAGAHDQGERLGLTREHSPVIRERGREGGGREGGGREDGVRSDPSTVMGTNRVRWRDGETCLP
ncbi:unnamed protein product [Darwinula stevensoni]|uniref:Uncharacterized protein n=1 Tax=Darwinula stevensoni TaxID=69355 RepID=A0A7R9AHC5_9CRUS|nr:unnamed protein product [Darwinula stevensoni]CAG0905221.1 unnamed protein product [Darwinula stevensoni]